MAIPAFPKTFANCHNFWVLDETLDRALYGPRLIQDVPQVAAFDYRVGASHNCCLLPIVLPLVTVGKRFLSYLLGVLTAYCAATYILYKRLLRKSHHRKPFPAWLLFALAAAVCWGIWGVLSKGPSRELSGWMTQLLFTFALLPSAVVAALSKRVKTGTNRARGLGWGFVSGVIAAVGNIAFYLALENGADTAIAIPLTNVYPLVTIVIAWFVFRERLNGVQGLGIVLALAAILLLSGEAKNLGRPFELLDRVSASKWMMYSLGAMVCWGVFSATQKISTNHISAEMSYLAWCAAFLPIAGWIAATKPLNWNMPPAMLWSGLAAGALNGFGVIAAFAAYRYEGKASVVTPLAAAGQPVVTVVLALLFLGERVGAIEAGGVVLAIAAAVALSYEGR
jgi:drug/metabolite transporter (DMT)-like permease